MIKKIICILTFILVIPIIVCADVGNSTDDDIFIKNGSRNEKIIAITFDDGPHPVETNKILDVLKKHDVCATFFIAGKHAAWYEKPLIRLVKEGHEIGNHTYNHPDVSTLSDYQIESEIIACEKIIFEKTGKKTNLFRPPYGNYNRSNMSAIAKKLGYKIILWTTIDTKDWQNPSAQSISQKIINDAQNGDIILLHDYATNNTVEALDMFIPAMKQKGYKFVTISQLIESRN